MWKFSPYQILSSQEVSSHPLSSILASPFTNESSVPSSGSKGRVGEGSKMLYFSLFLTMIVVGFVYVLFIVVPFLLVSNMNEVVFLFVSRSCKDTIFL